MGIRRTQCLFDSDSCKRVVRPEFIFYVNLVFASILFGTVFDGENCGVAINVVKDTIVLFDVITIFSPSDLCKGRKIAYDKCKST